MKIATKKKLMPLPRLLKKAQTVVNTYVRERDKDLGCIACGGEVEHAGHYFNQGHHSALRFDVENIHGSCVKCNLFLSGNLIKYRQGLVNRYGLKFVDNLESRGDSGPKKWSRTELNEIINAYSK